MSPGGLKWRCSEPNWLPQLAHRAPGAAASSLQITLFCWQCSWPWPNSFQVDVWSSYFSKFSWSRIVHIFLKILYEEKVRSDLRYLCSDACLLALWCFPIWSCKCNLTPVDKCPAPPLRTAGAQQAPDYVRLCIADSVGTEACLSSAQPVATNWSRLEALIDRFNLADSRFTKQDPKIEDPRFIARNCIQTVLFSFEPWNLGLASWILNLKSRICL